MTRVRDHRPAQGRRAVVSTPASLLLLAVLVGSLACGSLPWARPRPAWELPPPAARDAPVVQPGQLQRARLPNGVDVLVLEDARLPLVTYGLTVRRGAGIEALSEAGVAELAAEVMERGAGDRDALALARAIDEIGGSLGVTTGWDATTVNVAGLSRDRERLLEILADVVRRPRFEAREVEAARAQQLAGLEQTKDDPGALVNWHAMRSVYPDHRYGLPMSGTPETVAALDADAARGFYARVFTPANAIVYAVGDVEADAFLEEIGRALGDWTGGEVPPAVAPPPSVAPPARRVVVVDKPDLGQARIVLLHEGIARDDSRRIAASLVNDVLGGSGFSSRLMASVRAEAGLTYSVYSGFSLRRRPGPFQIATFTRVAQVRETVDLLLSGLEAIRTDPPSKAELANAKSYSTGRFGLGLETAGAVAASLVGLDVYGLPRDSLDTYRRRVRAVTTDDTARVARELFHPDRVAIVVLGPAADLVPQLEDLGPVEVVTP